MTREELIAEIIRQLQVIDGKLADLLKVPQCADDCEDVDQLLAHHYSNISMAIFKATEEIKEVQP